MASVAPKNHRHYTPVLKSKDGEFQALRELGASAKTRISPLVELAPPSRTQTLERACDRLTSKLKAGWGTADRIFVDTIRIDSAARTAAGEEAAGHLFKKAASAGVQAIPVTGLRRSPAHATAVKQHAADHGVGAALRIAGADARSATLPAQVAGILSQIGLQPDSVDLILDLESVDPGVAPIVGQGLVPIISALPHLADWRSFTVVSSAFPGNLGGRTGITTAPRGERDLWLTLLAQNPVRKPTYGDYAIETPGFFDFLPYMEPFAAIRYAATSEWLIVRGTSVRKPPKYDQFRHLSATVVAHRSFKGAAFSWGDGFIAACANGTGTLGSLTTWRAVGTNHHLELVASELPNIP